MSKKISVDENAYKILKLWKQICKKKGISTPRFSDCVREMHSHYGKEQLMKMLHIKKNKETLY